MCGLVGAVGRMTKKEKDAFRLMLILDVVRGPHSTGVASVDTSGSVEVVKTEGVPHNLFDKKSYDKMMNKTQYCVIGHNRYATQGAINTRNAHPFQFETVTGAHNGTLRAQYKLPDYKDFTVDSENIFHSIDIDGLDTTIPKLDGAYALTFWDNTTEELVMLRNDERELYVTFTPDRKTMFWASEAWMLSVALSRNGVKHEAIELLPVGQIRRIKPHRVFTNPNDLEVSVQSFTPFRPPVAQTPAVSAHHQGQGTLDKALEKEMLARRNNLVCFTYDRTVSTTYGGRYIVGHVSRFWDPTLKGVEIRIWETAKSDLVKKMTEEKDVTWEGRVVSAQNAGYSDAYFFLNPSSLTKMDEEDLNPSEETEAPWGDETPSMQEFQKATSNGCALCGQFPFFQDYDKLTWYVDGEYECQDCVIHSLKSA